MTDGKIEIPKGLGAWISAEISLAPLNGFLFCLQPLGVSVCGVCPCACLYMSAPYHFPIECSLNPSCGLPHHDGSAEAGHALFSTAGSSLLTSLWIQLTLAHQLVALSLTHALNNTEVTEHSPVLVLALA